MNEIKFGNYEQGNGVAPIEWLVLAEEDGRKLLLSKYALFAHGTHDELKTMTWDNCDLRKYLNSTFLETAFSAEEQKKIQLVKLPAEKSPLFEHLAGEDTEDKVFLLSLSEVEKYLPEQEQRVCQATPYAIENGAFVKNDGCYWWTRNVGYGTETSARIQNTGELFPYGTYVFIDSMSVRPAIWVNA